MSQSDWNALHARSFVADTHNDLLCAVVARPVETWGRFFRTQWIPQLRAGGVNLQVLPIFIDLGFQPEGSLRQTVRMIECAHRIAEECADEVTLCLDGSDVEAAVSAGRIALVLALESAPGVGSDPEVMDVLHRLGVRIASLAHFGRTPLADGSAEDLTNSRLTRAGVEVLELMQRRGIVYDVSHLGRSGVDHILELSRRPVIATHSSARALLDHHRNLTDDQLRGIAATGGVVCVNFFAPFLHATDHTVDRLIDHFEHMVEIVGVDAVGMGPDFIKEVSYDVKPRCCEDAATAMLGAPVTYLPGLEGPAGLPLVTQGLGQRGWAEEDITAVLGGNVRALLNKELGVPTS